MKTFKQFLESSEPKPLYQFDELIRKDCKAFAAESKQKGLIFRGQSTFGSYEGSVEIDGETFDLFKKTVRKDRVPMSTSKVISRIVDDWFNDELGFRARSQAVFCMGEEGRETAASYGDRSVIFPIGSFFYAWSPDVEDLFETLNSELYDGDQDLYPEFIDENRKPDIEAIRGLLDGLNYTSNGLDKAVKGNSEIMIACDTYYVIPYENEEQLLKIGKAFSSL